MIGGQVLGAGMESLRAQIYTAVHYRKEVAGCKRKCETGSDESDTESSTVSSISRKHDEYGCVEYQPLLPPTETKVTQEAKRLLLIQYYGSLKAEDDRIIKLMDETYSSQRMAINKPNRILQKILQDWPFLQDAKALLRHASRLIGKSVEEIWDKSLLEKGEPIRKYFKAGAIANEHQSGKYRRKTDGYDITQQNRVLTLLQEAKQAKQVAKSEAPLLGVVFLLIINHMKENPDLLFLVVDDDLGMEAVLERVLSETPTLIIRGKSYLDENAKYDIVLEKQISITTTGFLEGLLITFVAYYIFGYAYPANLSSSLEFIQRVILLINPLKGDKRDSKKRRTCSYDTKVSRLTNALNDFSSKF